MEILQEEEKRGCSDFSKKVVAETLLWLGTPYRHQGTMRGAGTDCLGLIRGVWRSVIGPEPASPPPYTTDWSESSGDEVLMRAANTFLKPRPNLTYSVGDILLFRIRDGSVAKHLGIVVQNDPIPKFVHAYTGHGVVENYLSTPWARRIVAVYSFPEGDQ